MTSRSRRRTERFCPLLDVRLLLSGRTRLYRESARARIRRFWHSRRAARRKRPRRNLACRRQPRGSWRARFTKNLPCHGIRVLPNLALQACSTKRWKDFLPGRERTKDETNGSSGSKGRRSSEDCHLSERPKRRREDTDD